MKKSIVVAATLCTALATPAYATVYDLSVYDTGFSGSLGSVTVTGEGVSSTLNFDVSLNQNVFFQMQGNGSPNDVFFFDLLKTVGGGTSSFTGNINAGNAAITTPNAPGGNPGGDYPTGGQFTVVKSLNGLGQGWASGFDYGVTDGDSSAGGNLNYYSGHLTFSLTALDGSLLSLASNIHNGATIYGAADLRQCPGTDATSGSCTTGPVGFTLSQTPTQQAAVPEPATWAMMLVGFGMIGGAMRRRKQHLPVRLSYALAN